MNNHVPSLITCQRLKELGYDKPTNFYYRERCADRKQTKSSLVTQKQKDAYISVEPNETWKLKESLRYTPAPIATELLEFLPDTIPRGIDRISLSLSKQLGLYTVAYPYNVEDESFPYYADNNFSEALAQMLIYLVENGIVEFNPGGFHNPDGTVKKLPGIDEFKATCEKEPKE